MDWKIIRHRLLASIDVDREKIFSVKCRRARYQTLMHKDKSFAPKYHATNGLLSRLQEAMEKKRDAVNYIEQQQGEYNFDGFCRKFKLKVLNT